MLRSNLLRGTITHLVLGVAECEGIPIPEPILEGDGDLTEIVLLEHILVPDHQLNDTEFISQR